MLLESHKIGVQARDEIFLRVFFYLVWRFLILREDMLATAVTKNGRPVEGMVRIADITSISKLSSASALTLQNLLEGPREVMRDYVVFFAGTYFL